MRSLVLIAAFATSGITLAADSPGKGKATGKIDRSKMFDLMDADKDGKVTKDEMKTWGEKMAEKLKEKGKGGKLGNGLGEKLFDRMDADQNGSITKSEFEKFERPDAAKRKDK